MDPADLIDHPPRDDERDGPVDLVGPVLARIRHEPPPARAIPALPLAAVVASMLGLALALEWLARQPVVREAATSATLASAVPWSLADVGIVAVVLATLFLLMGRRVTA